MEGQSIEVLSKSCLVELIGCCLQKQDSLQVAFHEYYINKFLDICIPALNYIKK
jgi:hypothetical protein